MDCFRRRIFEGPKQECAVAAVAAAFGPGDKTRPLSTGDVERAARAAEIALSPPEAAAVVRELHSSSAPSTPHANLMTTASAGYKTGPSFSDGTFPRPLSTVTARSRFDAGAVNHMTGLHEQQQQRQANRDAETDLHQLSKRSPPEHPRGGTVGNFLMRLRGPITDAKRRVIDRAWTRATDGAAPQAAPVDLVLSHYDALRAPRVARGDRSVDEEIAAVRAALTFSVPQSPSSASSSSAVSFSDFYDFHLSLAGLGLTEDKMFIGVVERLWRLDQPDRRLAPTDGELLQSKVPPLFKSSAYWGHEADNNDPDPNTDVDFRRGTEPQHKIVPFASTKAGVAPAHLHGAYAAPTLPAHKARTLRDGMETLGNTYAFTGQPSTAGVVKTDPKSRGFLSTDRSNAAYGAGALDDGPRDAFDEGRAKEDEIARRRRDLQLAPLETADPALWTTTHNREHPNWGKVISRGNPAILTSDATKAAQGAGAPLGLRPAYAKEMGDDELKQLERELKDHNRSYRKGAPTFDWRTTQREHFAPIDFAGAMDANDRFNPQPQAHATLLVARAMASQSGDVAAERAVLAASLDAEKRIGSLPTEYTDHMVDHKGEAEYDGTYHHHGVFNLIQGKQQIRVPWHKPHETLPGAALNANSIAPLQFTATTTLYHDKKIM